MFGNKQPARRPARVAKAQKPRTPAKSAAKAPARQQPARPPAPSKGQKGKVARSRAGESAVPNYVPSINLRSVDGHLTRTGSQVMAWYRLAPQAWSFRSDSQRELLIHQIAAQLGELQGRWLHLRVTTRPYPVHMWAEAFDHNALGRPPDVAGALGWDGFLEGEQRHLMGLSMSDKEVFLGVEVSGRGTLDRWVERAAPVLGKLVPGAVAAELAALRSEVRHIDELVAGTGLDAVPAHADDIAWLMHRSCALGLPAPRTLASVPGGRWETEDLAAFTDGVELHQEPYAPTVRVTGRLRSQTVTRHVAVLSVGLMDGLRIPEVDDPWMQRSDRLSFPVEWSARMYIRRPEDVTGELQRQMGKVRSQIRHYTHDHDLDPPMSLARQADRVLEIEDELSSGLTQTNTRLFGWWRIAVAGRDEAEAVSRAQQVLEIYRPKVAIEHPEAQYRYAREFIPGEPLASTAYRRRGSVTWAAAAVPAATAAVGDRRGIMLGETCTATRRPVAWDPWMAQEVRRASGLTAIVGGLGSGKALALDTPLPTPTGWTTMGEVEVGDELLDRDGRPTRVVAATEVMHGRPCYDVVFSDGSVIRADAQHEWLTRTRKDWKAADRLDKRLDRLVAAGSRPERSVAPGLCHCGCGSQTNRTVHARSAHGMAAGDHFKYLKGHSRRGETSVVLSGRPTVHTTEEIAASIISGRQNNHAVPVARAFDLPVADLAVDPYVLGAWLGDGTSCRAEITAYDPEIIAEIERTGQECRPHLAPHHYGLPGGLQQRLRDIGVLDNKHIPRQYLRASHAQRRALLAGLLDTDGYCTKTGTVEFSVTSERLARETRELILSLGYQARMRTTPCNGRSPETSTAYTVAFTTSDPVFRLPRKAARINSKIRSTNGYRYIVDVVPVESVPVRCVQVDNDEHLYLAGETCIPTHNSFLTGLIVYKTLRAGAQWTVLDPSGPLAELTRLPELAPFSRHINLLRADPGILNPYRVVAEPKIEHFLEDAVDAEDAERAWRRERSLAAATRRRLVLDVLTGLLPFDVARLPHTRIVLLRAVREVGGAPDRDPAQVIEVLRRHAREGEEHAGVVADFLAERRELPQAALLFPDETREDPWHADREYRLTVLTMQGMTLPRPGSPREEWTDGESLAVELLNLASWLTQRTIYDANRNLRKGVALDESHFLSQVPTGKVLIDRLARDSRKFNVRALFASQLAGDLLRVSGFASLVNAVFVGRTDDDQAQAEALRLLRVPTGVGYEQMLGTLSPRPRHDDRPDDTPRQFVFADGHGGVEKIRIDMEAPHLAHLAEALDTNPDASRLVGTVPNPVAGRGRGPSAVEGGARAAVTGPAPDLANGTARSLAVAPVAGANGKGRRDSLDDEEIDLLDDLDELDPSERAR
ncbi:ATP-binding protein [Pseudonocardia acaciae]|uniref:ATP-binding protein n=1 Tax=Pseudonocardia acaciae TaxID=551276 RepID=UPI000AF0CC02|nr:ATP-binding protein [Pseudonocardia acaciae]